MDTVTHNPLANDIELDVELVARFEEVFERCGKCLVGSYDAACEYALFDMLLVAEPGLYITTSDGLGCSKSTTFSVDIEEGAKPVCHELRRMSKLKYEFADKEVRKMLELGVIEKYLGPW